MPAKEEWNYSSNGEKMMEEFERAWYDKFIRPEREQYERDMVV